MYTYIKDVFRGWFHPLFRPNLDNRPRGPSYLFNVVSPGAINTPLASPQSADVIARIVSTVPMGRMEEPEEVAKVTLFLASDDSSFVTGIELFVGSLTAAERRSYQA